MAGDGGGDLRIGNKSDKMKRITENECNKKQGGAAGRLLDSDLSHENLQRETKVLCSLAPCGLSGFGQQRFWFAMCYTLHSQNFRYQVRFGLGAEQTKIGEMSCKNVL